MSDPTISEDIISGITDAMADLGATLICRAIAYSDIDINNPGKAPVEVVTDKSFEGLIFDFNDKYMPGTTVIEGDRMVLISMETFTKQQIANVIPGNYIVDDIDIYNIIKVAPIKVAGSVVVIIAQISK